MSRFIDTRARGRCIVLLTIAGFGSTLAGCASVEREPTYGLAPTDAAFVQQTCRQTLGVPPGAAEFDACAESLATSLHERISARRLDAARDGCERKGLPEGSAALDECVVLARKGANAVPRPVLPASQVTTNVPEMPALGHVSYFSMSDRAQDQHERLACAQLGLDPITGEFRECVSNIKQAMFDVRNPL